VTEKNTRTQFASAARSPQTEINRQINLFATLSEFKLLSDFVPDPLLVLNQNRQIVFANATALVIAASAGHNKPFGLRPGELLNCQHAIDSDCGCGTFSFCRYCGAVKAILSGLMGEQAMEECRLTQKDSGDAFIFMAHAAPYCKGAEHFALFMLRDITDEKRRQVLERIFFHDVRNTLTALHGWVNVLGDKIEGAELVTIFRTLNELSQELIDEIRAQEQLVKAENHTLSVEMAEVNSLAILKEIHSIYSKQADAENRSILIEADATSINFRSDASLLKRVLGNMLKNALEATPTGGNIRLDCLADGEQVHFKVHNTGYLTPEVQSQIFKISFSTKGPGRGLGTYSMRLLSERYLHGKVSFTTSPENGTTFTASYPVAC
jgi:hypothetical protein